MNEGRQRAFISGASRGIGLAIARRFHAAGWEVGTCARGAGALAAARAELPGLRTWVADLSTRAETRVLAAAVDAEMGPLDALVHNAGAFAPDDLTSTDEAVLDHLIELNLVSSVILSRRLVPAMRARGSGTVVHICSVASAQGYPSGLSYAATKHALLGLARSARAELRCAGVRVVSILPGATWTSTWTDSSHEPQRMMNAADVAEAVWMAVNAGPRTVVEELLLRPQLGDL